MHLQKYNHIFNSLIAIIKILQQHWFNRIERDII